jgi:hypothetical protein
MNTEYTGPRALAMWNEIRQRGLRASAWRAGYELRKRLGLVESSFRALPLSPTELAGLFRPALTSARDLRTRVQHRLNQAFFITPEGRPSYVDAIRRMNACRHDDLLTAADAVCRGHFDLMGHAFDFTDRPIDWHVSPDTGRSWPRIRWNRITLYGPSAAGDIKFTWELNRHQFWPTLGRAAWLTGDTRYAETWVRQMTGWLDDNPPEIGVNWLSNLEHAVRLLNWWVALAFFADSPALSDDLLARIVGTLVLKARHILADLDYSRINMANNHLLGDAMGLAVMGLMLPDLSEADHWRDVGLTTLWREAARQIHPDGTSFECAISYHRFVAYFYVVVLCLCRRAGVDVPDLVVRRLEAMVDFVLNLRRPDGGMPSIGDWDDGRTLVLSEQALDNFRPMLSTGAVLFNRPDFARAAGRLDEETLWLLGPTAAETFNSLGPDPAPRTSRAFPHGGYYISRSDDSDQAHYAVLRNGPFDSHTHADLLHVEMAAFGRPILVDPGTCTYNGPWEWRTYFRSSRAHNALLVDGQGQALAHRNFRWLFPPRGTTRAWQTESSPPIDFYEGEHDGFRRLRGRPLHRRSVLAARGRYWLVLDRLLGALAHRIELRLHFHPEMEVTLLDQGLQAASRDAVGATIALCASAPLDIATARGQTHPIDGWYSPGYGRKEPATTASITLTANAPAWIAWLVVPYRGHPRQNSLRPLDDGRSEPVTLRVEVDGSAHDLVRPPDSTCPRIIEIPTS